MKIHVCLAKNRNPRVVGTKIGVHTSYLSNTTPLWPVDLGSSGAYLVVLVAIQLSFMSKMEKNCQLKIFSYKKQRYLWGEEREIPVVGHHNKVAMLF